MNEDRKLGKLPGTTRHVTHLRTIEVKSYLMYMLI